RLTALRRNTMPFSPTLRIGLNYLALSGLLQQSAFSVQPANNSTNKHFNNSTTQHPKSIEGLKARIISAPSRKGGVSMSALYSEG
ncbi:hypothetical protein, partial [Tannerella forsythia]|uniref:hypothetical protein n=1 Tax=Tannerella forsythia TaxID=28112 RepID=UPI001C89C72F